MTVRRVSRLPFGVVVFALICLTACGDSGGGASAVEGSASGATCPDNSASTYDNFGRAFMETYCTRCHASALGGADRQGAPSDHDFDDLSKIRDFDQHIDEQAAAGPKGVNTSMPPSGAKPTQAERFELGEWLACGAPS